MTDDDTNGSIEAHWPFQSRFHVNPPCPIETYDYKRVTVRNLLPTSRVADRGLKLRGRVSASAPASNLFWSPRGCLSLGFVSPIGPSDRTGVNGRFYFWRQPPQPALITGTGISAGKIR